MTKNLRQAHEMNVPTVVVQGEGVKGTGEEPPPWTHLGNCSISVRGDRRRPLHVYPAELLVEAAIKCKVFILRC